MGEGQPGSLTDPHPLALQARLNASCVSPCHKASQEKKGQSVTERSLQKRCKTEAGDIGVRCWEGLFQCELKIEQLVKRTPFPQHGDRGLDEGRAKLYGVMDLSPLPGPSLQGRGGSWDDHSMEE